MSYSDHPDYQDGRKGRGFRGIGSGGDYTAFNQGRSMREALTPSQGAGGTSGEGLGHFVLLLAGISLAVALVPLAMFGVVAAAFVIVFAMLQKANDTPRFWETWLWVSGGLLAAVLILATSLFGTEVLLGSLHEQEAIRSVLLGGYQAALRYLSWVWRIASTERVDFNAIFEYGTQAARPASNILSILGAILIAAFTVVPLALCIRSPLRSIARGWVRIAQAHVFACAILGALLPAFIWVVRWAYDRLL